MRIRAAIRIPLVRMGFLLGRLLGRPPRRVVLATAHGEAISGNLAYVREELGRREPAVSTVTLAYRPVPTIRGLLSAAVSAFRSGYHLARARVFIVDDYFLPMYLIKPTAGTRFLQVWHASGAFKKFGYSVLDKTFGQTDAFVRRVAIHSNYDVCLVSASRFAPFYAEAFHQPLDRFDSSIGIPRTDVFFGDRRTVAEARVRARYLLPAKRTILFAPTFRGETISRARSPEELDLGVLRETLGEDHVVLLRQHPFVRSARPIDPALSGFVIDVSDYPDINELMLISDVLVTDYSSAIYEYSLLSRPMAFFAPDHEAYENERGFYFDFRSGVPGPVFETTDELARWLRAGEFDLDRVARFRATSFDVADGHATERFVDRLVEPALR